MTLSYKHRIDDYLFLLDTRPPARFHTATKQAFNDEILNLTRIT